MELDENDDKKFNLFHSTEYYQNIVSGLKLEVSSFLTNALELISSKFRSSQQDTNV